MRHQVYLRLTIILTTVLVVAAILGTAWVRAH